MPAKSLLPVYVMVGNILALFRAGSARYGYGQLREWARWYDTYRTMLTATAVEYGIPFANVAGAFAWLSPRSTVERNVANLRLLCDAYRDGTDPRATVAHTGQFIDKSWAALHGNLSDLVLTDSTSSRKVRTFYLNLVGDESGVTVDTHAVSIAMGAGTDRNAVFGQPNGGAYRTVEDAYRIAAKVLGFSPAQLQAAVWCVRRGVAH